MTFIKTKSRSPRLKIILSKPPYAPDYFSPSTMRVILALIPSISSGTE